MDQLRPNQAQIPTLYDSGSGGTSTGLKEVRDNTSYRSWHSNEWQFEPLPYRFGIHHIASQVQPPAEEHGASMKQKLNRLGAAAKPLELLLSIVPYESSSHGPASKCAPELCVPAKRPPGVNSAAHFDPPIHSIISPRSTSSSRFPGNYSPEKDSDLWPKGCTGRGNIDETSSIQAKDGCMSVADGALPLKRLFAGEIHSGRPKRRAANPPSTPRLARLRPLPTLSRSNSYSSTTSIAPTNDQSPYTTSLSLRPSPGRFISARTPVHSRTAASRRHLSEIQKPTRSNIQLEFTCNCCPKKPKRFDTEESLRAHAAGKQYNCAYCGNHFKNKNEAKRHQKSLHTRRYSWSCSALSDFAGAFHGSPIRPDSWDACGYCGLEFPRSGKSPIGQSVATDDDWDKRFRHLQRTHKFKECDSSKKFFRADHFRQHLKYSHGGTSGKWSDALENACLK